MDLDFSGIGIDPYHGHRAFDLCFYSFVGFLGYLLTLQKRMDVQGWFITHNTIIQRYTNTN